MRNKLYIVIVAAFVLFLINCSALVNPSPSIKVRQDSINIQDGGDFDCGQILVGEASTEYVFTIENLGRTKLIISNSPNSLNFSGDVSDFEYKTENVQNELKPGESTEFKVSFMPTSKGIKSLGVTIFSNDREKNQFCFTIVAEGVLPEINVKQDTTDLPSGSGEFDFGEIPTGDASPKISFTIENLGKGKLVLNGVPTPVQSVGDDFSLFDIDTTTTESSVLPGNTTTFSIAFHPDVLGYFHTTIEISNNDEDEFLYSFTVKGRGISAPGIDVRHNNISIPNGYGEFDFGEVLINTQSPQVVFTIVSVGLEDLELTGTTKLIGIYGSDATLFTVSQSMTKALINPGKSTVFMVVFEPDSIGRKTATISIANNDEDENPYVFKVTAYAIAPEINVKQDMNNIPCGTGIYDFGSMLAGNSGPKITFTIENLGTAQLTLTDAPDPIKIIGDDASMFILNQSTTHSSVNPHSSTTFSITFKPMKRTQITATISIANNDEDEDPYTFTIAGFGDHAASGDFNGDGIMDILTSAQHLDDNIMERPGFVYIFFGKDNWNSSINAANADVKISCENNNDGFGYNSISSAGDINNDGFDDIIISAVGFFVVNNPPPPGRTFIFFGRQQWESNLDANDANIKITGFEDSHFGCSVSAAGDVNGDCIDDVIIGAYNPSDVGHAYIYFGRRSWRARYDYNDANVEFTSSYKGDRFGISVSKAGDVNGDGLEDVIIGADQNDKGSAYIYFGRKTWANKLDENQSNVVLFSDTVEGTEQFGFSVSNAGDFNNDGFDDVVIGAQQSGINGHETGSVYLFYGRNSWDSRIKAANADVIILGTEEQTNLGFCVSSAGDVNNDGFDDIVTCIFGNWVSSKTGYVYILFGADSVPKTLLSSQCNVVISGEDVKYFGSSVSNISDINNDGFDDIIIGARHDEILGEYTGSVYLFYGRQDWSSVKTQADNDVKIIGEGTQNRFGYTVGGAK